MAFLLPLAAAISFVVVAEPTPTNRRRFWWVQAAAWLAGAALFCAGM